MVKITDEMREAIEDAIGSNASGGSIDKKKVGAVFRACGLNPTEGQMADWKKECGSGDVPADKMKSFVNTKLQESGDSQDEIIDAFSVFDKDGSGFIPVAEMKHVCCAMGEQLSAKEWGEVMRELDVGSDGMVNYRSLAEQLYNL
jgi:calmodulin